MKSPPVTKAHLQVLKDTYFRALVYYINNPSFFIFQRKMDIIERISLTVSDWQISLARESLLKTALWIRPLVSRNVVPCFWVQWAALIYTNGATALSFSVLKH